MDEIDKNAKIIWDYMLIHHEVAKADIILALGAKDVGIVHRACDLYFAGYAPVMIFSGGMGKIQTIGKVDSEIYKDIAISLGVPDNAIYLETKSTNTGENIEFTKNLITAENLKHNSVILVQKPYMERRSFATFKKLWPEQKVIVTSPQVNYENYIENNPNYTKDTIINLMVGDLERIKKYPDLGFQIPQEIPGKVWEAFEKLVSLGFNKYLVK